MVGISDILVVVLIADAAQNGMSGDYLSIPEGLVLVGTILGWAYVIDWLTFHSDVVRHFVEPAPLPLVIDGVVQYRNLRRKLIRREELDTQLREQGIDRLAVCGVTPAVRASSEAVSARPSIKACIMPARAGSPASEATSANRALVVIFALVRCPGPSA